MYFQLKKLLFPKVFRSLDNDTINFHNYRKLSKSRMSLVFRKVQALLALIVFFSITEVVRVKN